MSRAGDIDGRTIALGLIRPHPANRPECSSMKRSAEVTHRIFLVSYPRSGQHYCQRLLERVSGIDDYCELYHCLVEDCPGKLLKPAQRTPCPAGRRIQKTHDFTLDFPVFENARYAVLVRKPIYSIISYYEHSSRSGKGVSIEGCIRPHTLESLHRFCTLKARYWSDFVSRWLELAKRHSNIRFFNYDSLVSDKHSIIEFCDFVLEEYSADLAGKLADKQVAAYAEGRVGRGKLDTFRHPKDEILPILEDIIDPDLLQRVGLDAYL